MTWHKYPDEKPTEDNKYLVCEQFADDTWYAVADYSTDLYKLDNWNFDKYQYKHKAGFAEFDSEFGYIESIDVIAWCEIEEYKGGL